MGFKITALKAQKRKKDRVNIYLDGEYAFSLSRITSAWLSIGQELSGEKIAELKSQDTREVAYTKTLQRLNHRDYSKAEIRRRLERNGTPVDVTDDVLKRLDRAGLVDDEKFAQNWVENRTEFRPRGRRALAYELRSKGVHQEIIEKASIKSTMTIWPMRQPQSKRSNTGSFHWLYSGKRCSHFSPAAASLTRHLPL